MYLSPHKTNTKTIMAETVLKPLINIIIPIIKAGPKKKANPIGAMSLS
ncbi:hypothetical protein ME788_15430 [Lactobacillus delbrueckii]|nr:hypothetical protein ME786_17560 [Lactobacillus delbrueckii]GHN28731.1 hypothetical protein ME788_15430 [Lactobacillus delbrueckii]